MKTAIIGFVGTIIGAVIGAGTTIYIHIQNFGQESWTLPSQAGKLGSPFVIDNNKFAFVVCYDKGDGEFIYVDNSNDLPEFPLFTGNVSNYPRIKLGECEIVTGNDSPNIGFFLDTQNNATTAKGTWRFIDQ